MEAMKEKISAIIKGRKDRILYKEAMKFYKTGQYGQAIQIFERLGSFSGLHGHMVKFYYARSCRKFAEELIEKGKFNLAIEYLNRAVKINPASPELLSFLASYYVSQGQYKSAAEQFETLSNIDPINENAELRSAIADYLAGRYEKSIGKLKKLVHRFPSNFTINYYLGTFLSGQEDYNQAIIYLTKASQLRPEDPQVHLKLGLAHGIAGHIPQAVYHISKAHKLDPANNWILMHLVLAVKHAKHLGLDVEVEIEKIDNLRVSSTPNIEKLAELISQESEFVTAFLDLPETGIDEDIFSSLLRVILKALEKHPEYADLHYHCSCVYQRLNKFDEAIEETEKALELNPRYLNALIQLARLYSKTNKEAQAIDRLKTAITLGANYPDIHYMLGNLYRRSGKVEDAKLHYERALKLNPEYKEAKKALEALVAA